MLTCETPLPAGHQIHTRGRLRQNAGRLQIGMLDGIRPERRTPSAQNAWTDSLRICNMWPYGSGVGPLTGSQIAHPSDVMHPELLVSVALSQPGGLWQPDRNDRE
jgi:hypothetical protein